MNKLTSNPYLFKTLVVVMPTELMRIREIISDRAAFGWEAAIELIAMGAEGKPRYEKQNIIDDNTFNLISNFSAGYYFRAIVQNKVALNIKRLRDEDVDVIVATSTKTLLQHVADELKKRNLDWRTNAIAEWQKSSIKHANPDMILQQFSELGYAEIGKKLIKGIRVLSESDLRGAFKSSAADNVGSKVLHAFVKDDESGSSSIAINNVLSHLYPSDQVVQLDVDNLGAVIGPNIDVVYIYEDGLWSGVELVKRLNSISKNAAFVDSHVRLCFKYGVTSDVGLIAGRLFASREKIGRLVFEPSLEENHLTFLDTQNGDPSEKLKNKTDDEIRSGLDSQIAPYAFRDTADWGDLHRDAIAVCKDIGKQLVGPFLEARERVKTNAKADPILPSDRANVPEEKIMRWALGALGFASTVVFSSSVPKPVLPLLWLTGPVTIGGKTIDWRPLFWDVRRIGYPDPHRSYHYNNKSKF